VITCRTNIVAISPQLAAPVRPTQARELRVQLSCCQALDHVHHLRRRIAWRTTDKQMHVVLSYCQCLYLPISRRADLTYQLLQPPSNVPGEHCATVAGYPDKVICQPIDCMCASSGFHHDGDYSMARSRGPLRGPHIASRATQKTAAPAFGGPAFLPAASGGVSSRRFS